MKNNIRHIAYSWVVLVCFVAGQLLAVVHTHNATSGAKLSYQATKQTPPQQQPTVAEKCYVCDMMHHTQMVLFSNVAPIPHYTLSDTQYKCEHDYIGIALILSAGRSPPSTLS